MKHLLKQIFTIRGGRPYLIKKIDIFFKFFRYIFGFPYQKKDIIFPIKKISIYNTKESVEIVEGYLHHIDAVFKVVLVFSFMFDPLIINEIKRYVVCLGCFNIQPYGFA